MKEKLKTLEQKLSEGFTLVKDIVYMKKLIFQEGNLFMRAFIYAVKFFFFAYVIYAANNFLFGWVDNEVIRNLLFIFFLSLAVLISIGSVMIDIDEMKEKFNKEREECKKQLEEKDRLISFYKEKYEYCSLYERKYYDLYEAANATIEKMISTFYRRDKKNFGKWVVKPAFKFFPIAYKIGDDFNEYIEKINRISERYEDYIKELNLEKKIEKLKS